MIKRQYFLFLSLLVLWGCANLGAGPTGGPQDKKAPVLKESESTENFQTNFKKQDIELVFDEYVELKDIFKQVIISPPLRKRWKLSSRLKTVTFEFDTEEELRPDATYTINFGEAVRDYTAGNKVPDLRFVFSTGDFIDSMEVSGNIVDAITGKPVENTLLMLYDNFADTVVRTERPFYFARTDKEGNYKIQNVKSDTFKVFALNDEGQQYLFDQETESIGFPDSLIILTKNKEAIPPISLFLERPSLRLTPPRNDRFGKIKLKFNQEPFDVKISHEDIGQEVIYEMLEDSIYVWYDQTDTISWNIFIAQGEEFRDTFLVQPPDKSRFLETDSLRRDNARDLPIINVNPTKEIRIAFNHPLESLDSAKILLLKDSTLTPVVPVLKLKEKELIVQHRWQEAMTYRLLILPQAITDLFGLQNRDTITQNYTVFEKKAFSDIDLKVTDLDSTQNYVINVFLGQKPNLVESKRISGQTNYERSFKTIPAGQYIVEIIVDLNGNGRWDTGNYDLMVQPEPFATKSLEKVIESWSIEAKISAKDLLKQK